MLQVADLICTAKLTDIKNEITQPIAIWKTYLGNWPRNQQKNNKTTTKERVWGLKNKLFREKSHSYNIWFWEQKWANLDSIWRNASNRRVNDDRTSKLALFDSKSGDSGGSRTHNLLLRTELLYPLSYQANYHYPSTVFLKHPAHAHRKNNFPKFPSL